MIERPLLSLTAITKRFGAIEALRGVTFTVLFFLALADRRDPKRRAGS